MSEYRPDRWVIIRLVGSDTFKVFATWGGGYGGSDSWRISSGIVSITEEGHYYNITNHSGSVYLCHKDGVGVIGGVGIPSLLNISEADKIEIVSIQDFLDEQKGHI